MTSIHIDTIARNIAIRKWYTVPLYSIQIYTTPLFPTTPNRIGWAFRGEPIKSAVTFALAVPCNMADESDYVDLAAPKNVTSKIWEFFGNPIYAKEGRRVTDREISANIRNKSSEVKFQTFWKVLNCKELSWMHGLTLITELWASNSAFKIIG